MLADDLFCFSRASQSKIAVCQILVGRAEIRIHGDGRLSFFDRAFEVADALKDSPRTANGAPRHAGRFGPTASRFAAPAQSLL